MTGPSPNMYAADASADASAPSMSHLPDELDPDMLLHDVKDEQLIDLSHLPLPTAASAWGAFGFPHAPLPLESLPPTAISFAPNPQTFIPPTTITVEPSPQVLSAYKGVHSHTQASEEDVTYKGDDAGVQMHASAQEQLVAYNDVNPRTSVAIRDVASVPETAAQYRVEEADRQSMPAVSDVSMTGGGTAIPPELIVPTGPPAAAFTNIDNGVGSGSGVASTSVSGSAASTSGINDTVNVNGGAIGGIPFVDDIIDRAAAAAAAAAAAVASAPKRRRAVQLHRCPHVGCTRAFPLKSNLKKHRESVHLKLRPYKCDRCSRTFYERCKLRGHIATVHEGQRNFPCTRPGCPAAFKQNSDRKRHIREVHQGKPRW